MPFEPDSPGLFNPPEYFCVLEALHNLARHADARASVHLSVSAGDLRLKSPTTARGPNPALVGPAPTCKRWPTASTPSAARSSSIRAPAGAPGSTAACPPPPSANQKASVGCAPGHAYPDQGRSQRIATNACWRDGRSRRWWPTGLAHGVRQPTTTASNFRCSSAARSNGIRSGRCEFPTT